MKANEYKLMFVYGFAIFAMFFGSGNLVFPLKIGQIAGDSWLFGFFGLFVTGILLPFLGLFVIKLHKGSYTSFFKEAGEFAGVILPLFTLSLLGAFGVVPRCITVAYGEISSVLPNVSLCSFSLAFCVTIYFICLKNHIMINLLGKWMSPLLLLSLACLIIVGIFYSPSIIPTVPKNTALSNGFLTGYQTMDLFAAFFFSSLIFNQIKENLPNTEDHRAIIAAALKPSIVGALMLATVYLGFVFLGAHYGELIKDVTPELMLSTISTYALGSNAALLITVAVVFSCLTTAVALNNIYAQYLIEKLNLKKNYFPLILSLVTIASFFMSLLNFKKIASLLGPILEISYPGLITLTILSIFIKEKKLLKVIVFYVITAIMFISKC